jgi:hypothetical protein
MFFFSFERDHYVDPWPVYDKYLKTLFCCPVNYFFNTSIFIWYTQEKSHCCNNIIKFRLFVMKFFREANERFVLFFHVLLSFCVIQISSLLKKFASISFPILCFA